MPANGRWDLIRLLKVKYLNVIHARELTNNSHNTTNKCTDVKLCFDTQIVTTPTCFDLS